MAPSLNEDTRLASGCTSDVYAWTEGTVIKLLRSDIPPAWAEHEARVSTAIHRHGLPIPEVVDLVVVDGRHGVVSQRVEGPSLWQQMCTRPKHIAELVPVFAGIQQLIHSAGLPPEIPDLVGRMQTKIRAAEQLSDPDRSECRQILSTLPRGAALLHGDLHPGNILMSRSGPMVIDWFDASIGHPVADIVRTSILIRPSLGGSVPLHLPQATDAMLHTLHDTYLRSVAGPLQHAPSVIRSWEAVVGASRLAEPAEVDEDALLELWWHRQLDTRSELLAIAG